LLASAHRIGDFRSETSRRARRPCNALVLVESGDAVVGGHLLQRYGGKRLDADRLAFRTPALVLKRPFKVIRRDLPGAVGLAFHGACRPANGFQSADMRFDKPLAGGRIMEVV
jgi:hypothetical protein